MYRRNALGQTDIAAGTQALAAITADPCLPQTARLVLELQAIERLKPDVSTEPGIGLCALQTPLLMLVAVRRQPWLFPVGLAVVVGGLVAIGYSMGKR